MAFLAPTYANIGSGNGRFLYINSPKLWRGMLNAEMTIKMGYAGDISALECFEKLSTDQKAQLIDVRTMAEWSFVGIPDLNSLSKKPLLVEWLSFPTQTQNDDFASTLTNQLNALGVEQNTALYFLCRSGARSQAAATMMSAHGFSQCFNVTHGFEGDLTPSHQRGHLNGWKADGLPWMQQ